MASRSVRPWPKTAAAAVTVCLLDVPFGVVRSVPAFSIRSRSARSSLSSSESSALSSGYLALEAASGDSSG